MPSFALRPSGKPRNYLASATFRAYKRQTQLRGRRRSFNFERASWDCRVAALARESQIDHQEACTLLDSHTPSSSTTPPKAPMELTLTLHRDRTMGQTTASAQTSNINCMNNLASTNRVVESDQPHAGAPIIEELVPGSDGLTHQWPSHALHGAHHDNRSQHYNHITILDNFFKEYHSRSNDESVATEEEDEPDNSAYTAATLERAAIKGDDTDIESAVAHIEGSIHLKQDSLDEAPSNEAIDLYTYSEELMAHKQAAKAAQEEKDVQAAKANQASAPMQTAAPKDSKIQLSEEAVESDFVKFATHTAQNINEQFQHSLNTQINNFENAEAESGDSSPCFMYQLFNNPERSMPCIHPKAVIFDLDGTLLDTAPDIIGACNATLRHYGFDPISDDLALTKITAGMRELLKLGIPVSEQSKLDISGVMREYFAQYYLNHICERTVPFRGMFELLNDLFSANIKVGVVTSKYSKMAHKLMSNFSFYKKLDLIIGCDDTIHVKPHPEPIIKAINALNVAPYEAVYVGDHINDILSANAARVHSAAATWGYGEAECGDPKNWHAQFILDDVSDLHQLTLDSVE